MEIYFVSHSHLILLKLKTKKPVLKVGIFWQDFPHEVFIMEKNRRSSAQFSTVYLQSPCNGNIQTLDSKYF